MEILRVGGREQDAQGAECEGLARLVECAGAAGRILTIAAIDAAGGRDDEGQVRVSCLRSDSGQTECCFSMRRLPEKSRVT
jgi:hypothetical protein